MVEKPAEQAQDIGSPLSAIYIIGIIYKKNTPRQTPRGAKSLAVDYLNFGRAT